MCIRDSIDTSSDSFNKRIRNAVTSKIPNMLIVGEKERDSEGVAWRRYASKEQRTLPFAEFKIILQKMVKDRVMDNFSDEVLPEAS